MHIISRHVWKRDHWEPVRQPDPGHWAPLLAAVVLMLLVVIGALARGVVSSNYAMGRTGDAEFLQLERVGFSPFVQLDTNDWFEPQRKNCCGDGGRYSNYLKGGIFSIVSAGLLVLGLKLIYQGIKSSYFNSVPSGLTAIGGAAIVIFLSLFVFFFLLLGIPLP